MVLHGLQSLLGRLYDVDLNYDVYDFLVTDRRALQGLAAAAMMRGHRKRNCCWRNRTDGAGVALYLDPALLRRLEGADPVGALTEDNLADYCTALEGVSHFVYSTWRLDRDLPVSLLELETQAEVDKYAVTVFLLAQQLGGGLPCAGACAAVRSRQLRCAPGARSISSLPHGAPLRGALLPPAGASLREPGAGANRSAGARICAGSIVWEAPRNCATRWREHLARRRGYSVVVLVARGLFLRVEEPRSGGANPFSSAVPAVCRACRCRTGRSPSWCRSGLERTVSNGVRGIVGDRQGGMLELLQPLGRDLAAERAGGDRPLPHRRCRARRICTRPVALPPDLAPGLAPPGGGRSRLRRRIASGLAGGLLILCSRHLFMPSMTLSQPGCSKIQQIVTLGGTSSYLQVTLGAPQRQGRFAVVPLARAAPARPLRPAAAIGVPGPRRRPVRRPRRRGRAPDTGE